MDQPGHPDGPLENPVKGWAPRVSAMRGSSGFDMQANLVANANPRRQQVPTKLVKVGVQGIEREGREVRVRVREPEQETPCDSKS